MGAGLFTPKTGAALWGYIIGSVIVGLLLVVALSFTPQRARKPLIAAVTFVAGLFFALEFFYPVATEGPDVGKNFLTPYLKPISDMTVVLQAFAIGLGVYSLASVHLRNVSRRREGWGFSVLLLGATVAMAVVAITKEYRPSPTFRGLYSLLYDGMFNSLNSAMFSLVAFYIVSAAYRAFRVRSREATWLLASSFILMLGQVALGQALTAALPNEGVLANARIENLANWLLTRVNSPAVLAVEFGLGIGSLATALRLWLSLERGSYFDEEL